MTKRFKLRAVNDKRTYGAISENGELIKMDNVVDLLNALNEENQFKRKHILCLQSTIQDIDVELSVKGTISKERFEEIKNHWATKMLRDDLE